MTLSGGSNSKRLVVEQVRADEVRDGDLLLVANLHGTVLARGVNCVRRYVPEAGGNLSFDVGDRWVPFEDAELVMRVLAPSPSEPDADSHELALRRAQHAWQQMTGRIPRPDALEDAIKAYRESINGDGVSTLMARRDG